MTDELVPALGNMLMAVLLGGLIGIERSYNGRPAGFRTHTLVCLASSILMMVTLFQGQWFCSTGPESVRIDPTRMAQGVMTGIGFLGAGVIVKEGLSVRGLTTAASIWITAAIGILAGVGLNRAALAATALTLAVLTLFRWIESRIPVLVYADHSLKFDRDDAMTEPEIRETVGAHGVGIAHLSYSVVDGGAHVEYRMTLKTREIANFRALSQTLASIRRIVEYRIEPTGD
jgi:putative Mg2+ transporter-C (MgtC) family protein